MTWLDLKTNCDQAAHAYDLALASGNAKAIHATRQAFRAHLAAWMNWGTWRAAA